ncbi:hypothetical protein G4V62_18405 [Bacillaceae bacterium SIJ1]|uniref:hypothetical protein n=1 Tax=Litoribacterium kuwaitense TaxID=1398745 RepID=UPI0013ED55E3|nr:hypothetical protein [Litoribacterium kuwaitense]NGP46816.1 hypothetical protein [Litoribacterium kuwaitense]
MKANSHHRLWSILIFILGAGFISFAIMSTGEKDMFLGVGGGMIGVAVVRLLQGVKMKKDQEYAKKMEVNQTDERNQFVATTSRAKAFEYSLLIEGVIVIISLITGNPMLAQTIGLLICVQVIVYFIVYFANNKKY